MCNFKIRANTGCSLTEVLYKIQAGSISYKVLFDHHDSKQQSKFSEVLLQNIKLMMSQADQTNSLQVHKNV